MQGYKTYRKVIKVENRDVFLEIENDEGDITISYNIEEQQTNFKLAAWKNPVKALRKIVKELKIFLRETCGSGTAGFSGYFPKQDKMYFRLCDTKAGEKYGFKQGTYKIGSETLPCVEMVF